jgi:hypothetical protein
MVSDSQNPTNKLKFEYENGIGSMVSPKNLNPYEVIIIKHERPYTEEVAKFMELKRKKKKLKILRRKLKQQEGYEPPDISPTNKEMHSVNGNLAHQHDNGSASFFRAAARGMSRNSNSADRFAAGTLAQTALVGGGLAYSGFKDMGKPLNELREQMFGRVGPSHKELIKNNNFPRNQISFIPGDESFIPGPKLGGPHIINIPNSGGKDKNKNKIGNPVIKNLPHQ